MEKTRNVGLDKPHKNITEYLKASIQAISGKPVKRSDETRNIMDLGIDSISLVSISDSIKKDLGIELPPTVFFEYQSISDLARFLESDHPDALTLQAAPAYPGNGEDKASAVPAKNNDKAAGTDFTLDQIFSQFPAITPAHQDHTSALCRHHIPLNEDIAVIGMAGKFPGSKNLDEFWKNLAEQTDLFRDIPEDHFEYKKWREENPDVPDAMYCTRGSFIDDVDKFDAAFFNIPPQEAAILDPQLRHLLEVIYHTIEDAGYANKIRGTNTGMYVGACFHDYELELVRHLGEMSPYFGIGNALTMLANRPSFYLNLKGPSLPLDTACSASLVAINSALSALRNGECDMAFVAGTNLVLSPLHFRYFCTIGALSKSGGSYPFDSRADGYLPGEAVAAVLLKPLSKAEQDGDQIHAVIKSSAVNHGGYSASFTAPNVTQEAAVIEKALKAGNLPAESISYIEAHGTGTSLGDPIEVNGLKLAFKDVDHRHNRCALTTAKAHIGHAEGAAGIVGLLKVILSMKHKTIPAMPHLRDVNPYVTLENTPFVIPRTNQYWQPNPTYPRRAGISSFGIGGAYAHVIVEEYSSIKSTPSSEDMPSVFVVSARSRERLMTYAGNLAQRIELKASLSNTDVTLPHLAALVANATHGRIQLHDQHTLIADIGFHLNDYMAITKAIEEHWQISVTPRLIALQYSVNDLLNALKKAHATTPVHFETEDSLQDLAFTMQTGREAMAHRLAIVANNKRELIEELRHFACTGETSEIAFFNTLSDDQELDDFLDCPEGENFIGALARSGRLTQLAKLWVKGAHIPWQHIPANRQAKLTSLPHYPFARHRYWYTDDAEKLVSPPITLASPNIESPKYSSDIHSLVKNIWLKYLSVPDIQPDDNFIALGGTSITTTQVVTELNRKLSLDITIGAFSQCNSFNDLCTLIEQETGTTTTTTSDEFVIPISQRHDDIPLSSDQLRLWVLSQMYPNNTRHNISAAYRLRGKLDKAHLQHALNVLVARHKSLRTIFALKQGEPVQKVVDHLHVDLEWYQLAKHTSPYTMINQAARTLFDITKGPLLKVTLIETGEDDYVLSIVVHHIIADISSCDIIARELIQIFSAVVDGAAPDHHLSMNGQFTDYLVWLHNQDGSRKKKDLDFWQKFLADAPASLNLPLDFPRQTQQTFRAEQVSFELDSEIFTQLDALARQLKATRFSLVFSVFNLLLARLCQQDDILIGVPNANRHLPDTRNMVGFLSNTLVLRSKINLQGTFDELIEHTKASLYQAFDHQSVGYGDVVSHLNIPSPKNHNPLFQILFNMIERDEVVMYDNDLRLSLMDIPLITLDFDILFTVDIRGDNLRVFMDFNPDLFTTQTATHILESFQRILRDISRAQADNRAYDLVSTPLLVEAASSSIAQKPKLIISSTFTAEPLADSLQFWLDKVQLDFVLEFAAYNQVFQSLLDPGSSLNQNHDGMNLVLVRYDDWLRFDTDRSIPAEQRKRAFFAEFLAALRFSTSMQSSPLILAILPSHNEHIELHHQLNQELADVVSSLPNVRLLDAASVIQTYPVAHIFDEIADNAGHIPYKPDYFTALGTSLIRKVRSLATLPYKVIVLDCDNTLWQGVVGEVGPQGIVFDEARLKFHNFLIEQSKRGVLLCLASKNIEDDVLAVFNSRADMPLTRENILTWKINWQPKSENLKQLSEELKLGLDSFIFIDDNPVECAEVESALPQVLTIQFPQEAEEINHLCYSIWDLDIHTVTDEDKQRTAMYKQNLERHQAENQAGSFEDFLSRLELKIDIADMDQDSVERVEQLMQRTNQFNATTRRHTASEMNSKINHENYECKTFHVRDRFGDYGLVGVLFYQVNTDHIRLDSFLLSCRVLGKGVEHHMLNSVAQRAVELGIDTLYLEYDATEKNVPIHIFYKSIPAACWHETENYFSLNSTQGASLRFEPSHAEKPRQSRMEDAETTQPKPQQSTKSPRAMAVIARELNSLDKISAALRETLKGRSPSSKTQPTTIPANELEATLALIYGEILRTEHPNTETSFFDLGGTSLQLIELASRVSEQMEKSIPITTLFQFPSIASLARHLSGSDEKKGKMSKARERAQRQRQMIRRLQVA
ncbi:HAD-IIIC family phosphatase [Cellvibrio sp. ARAG 10.3]|uniref:HAD-IIIC family phosphatase n=1 Tax=Cellvibrio sp. ARAG 10.3 TaxID=3451358 RepID=UPI003F490554